MTREQIFQNYSKIYSRYVIACSEDAGNRK